LVVRGWEVLIVWECEIRKPDLSDRLLRFLEAKKLALGSGVA
jgi:G:T-mismatch repair DNA endonuclease (very short patch repair protein)